MQILEVNIDRFGQFYNWSCAFPSTSFLSIYGPNEAGKSTLVAFIKCILFGFPRKTELEPYMGYGDQKSDLGGSVTLRLSELGKVKVVRHHQRKGGRATLFMENGEIADENILSDHFNGIDRDLFETIFCFDLEGLKGIEKLKPEELNRFLFSTGMMGSAELYELEKSLEKQSGELFKSGGRNPLINQSLSELTHLRSKLGEWEKQMDEYVTLKKDAEHIKNALEDALSKRRVLENEKREFQRFKASESLLIDYLEVKKETEAMPDTSTFPEDGKARYDHWRTHVVSLQGELADIEQKIKSVMNDVSAYTDDAILHYERDILNLERLDVQRTDWERELGKLKEQIRREQALINADLEQLNLERADIETIKAIPLTLSSKQQLKDWMNKYREEIERKKAFELTIEEAAGKLQRLKERREALTSDIMPESQFAELEYRIKDHQSERVRIEKEHLDQRQKELKRAKELKDLLGKLKMGLAFGSIIIFTIITVLFASSSLIASMVFGFGGLVITAAMWFIFNGLQKRLKIEQNEREISKRKEEIDGLESTEISQSDYLYQQEKGKREQLALAEAQIEDAETAYHTYIQKLDQINMKLIEIETGIDEWRTQMGLPHCETALLPDVYQLIEKLRGQITKWEELKHEASEYQKRIDTFHDQLKTLTENLGIPGSDWHYCVTKLDHAKAKKDQQQNLLDTLDHLQENRTTLLEKISKYELECINLMAKAGVQTEEDFYQICRLVERKAEKENHLESLYKQLCHLVPQEDMRDIYFGWLSEGRWKGNSEEDFSRQMDEWDRRIREHQQRLSDIATKLEHMEKDYTYAELTHEYEEKQYFLNELAKKWGTVRVALSVLKQAKESYRETRLPKVLAKAAEYLYQITNQKYINIYFTETEGFTVEHQDGSMFSAAVLSRGAAEQLYLSLKLALIDAFETEETLPVIIDDGFVNFDGLRRKQVLDVLKHAAKDRQILLLTCHRYTELDILELAAQKSGGERPDVGIVVSDTAR
ncbi:MAG: AAA family ATPase [Tuberibacillus sp.]